MRLGASVGMAVFPDDSIVIEELIDKADQAMYAHKRAKPRAPR